jgi:hypothetical protein
MPKSFSFLSIQILLDPYKRNFLKLLSSYSDAPFSYSHLSTTGKYYYILTSEKLTYLPIKPIDKLFQNFSSLFCLKSVCGIQLSQSG